MLYCLEVGCKHKRLSAADMVQCSHCALWHHLDCVGLLQSDTICVWPCPSCRVQSDMLHQCHKMLQEITSQLAALQLLQDNVHKDMGYLASSKNLEKSNQDLVKLLGSKTGHCDVLVEENIKLKCQIKQLQSGGRITQLQKTLDDSQDVYETVVLVVGGNNRASSMMSILVTEAPHNTNFRTWMGKKQFCFFQTAVTGNRTPDSGVKGSGANHYPRAPALHDVNHSD